MTYHVDVIQTDWSAGVERLAARLVLNGNEVEVEDTASADLPSKLLAPIPDGFGELVTPAIDAKLFLTLLVERLADGTYVRAFAPHPDFECPFGSERELPMTPVGGGPQFS
jgi:hypothetical protein